MGTDISQSLVGSGSYQKVNFVTYFKEGHIQMKVRFPKASHYPVLWPALWCITFICFIRNTYTVRNTTFHQTLHSFKKINQKTKLIHIFENSDSWPGATVFTFSLFQYQKVFHLPAGNQDLYSHRHQQIPPPFHSQRKCPDHNLPQFLRDLQFFPSVCQLCKSLSPHRIASIFLKNLSDSPQRFFMLHIFHFPSKNAAK